MIKRKWSDDDLFTIRDEVFDPGTGLKHIGDHILVSKNRTLRYTGCSTCVLEKSSITKTYFRLLECLFISTHHTSFEIKGLWKLIIRNHLLNFFNNEIHDVVLRKF